MSTYETSITNPKKQLEFYKQLSEELQQENQRLKTQQQEFVNFLEDMWKQTQDIWYIKILYKYEEIIGNDTNVGSKGENKDENNTQI